jgi:hypothetical protein
VSWIDDRGRLFGRVSIIDLLVAVIVLAVGAVAYQMLTAPDRLARPWAGGEHAEWLRVEVRLPAEDAWLAGRIDPGMAERDPRTGDARAEVLAVRPEGDAAVVALRLRAARDPRGRWFYGNIPLVPGRVIDFEGEEVYFEGPVASVEAAVSGAGS